MALNKFIKDYFSFSRKEGTAAIILAVIIGIFIALPYLITSKKKKPEIDKKMLEEVTKLQAGSAERDSNHYPHREAYTSKYVSSSNENPLFEPFNFDPNTVDEAGWHKLGLRDKTIHTIINYRSKGGKFRQAEDIKKIWGLRPEEAERLLPYIRIAATDLYKKKEYTPYKPINNKPQIVDINTATVEELRIIPGTGNGLLYRLLKYRERLGGFINIDQIKETYGMTDSSFALMQPYLKLNTPAIITKLNINTASDYELGGHPYIERNIAKAIVLYRQQHGNYQSTRDIMKIVFIKEALYQKIAPYITVQ